MKSRCTIELRFPNYTAEELEKMIPSFLGKGSKLGDDANAAMRAACERIAVEARSDNARGLRTVIEHARDQRDKRNQDAMDDESRDFFTITRADVEVAERGLQQGSAQ